MQPFCDQTHYCPLSHTYVLFPHPSFSLSGPTGSPSQPIMAKRKKLQDSVFNRFDDEEADEGPKKRKLVPLDYDDEKSQGLDGIGLGGGKGANSEEKRKHIKSLIEKIPTGKPELFNYPLDWSIVDTVSFFSIAQGLGSQPEWSSRGFVACFHTRNSYSLLSMQICV